MAVSFKIGDLRHHGTIQRADESQNTDGEIVQTWATYASGWFDIRPLSGREYMDAQQANADVTHTIRCHYKRGVTPKMRLLCGSRVFEFLAVINWGERNEELRIMAREVM